LAAEAIRQSGKKRRGRKMKTTSELHSFDALFFLATTAPLREPLFVSPF
jgi:hypothetical protein